MACREHLNVHRLHELRDTTVHDLLARCDAFRKPDRIAQLAIACEADKRGRAGLQDEPYPQRAELLRLHAAALAVRGADVARSEEHTSELQSLMRNSYAVFCLKKKKNPQ